MVLVKQIWWRGAGDSGSDYPERKKAREKRRKKERGKKDLS
jgi:hypothetical protein